MSYLALAVLPPLRAQVQALHGGVLLESWEARMAVSILARTISYLVSVAGEAVVVVVVVSVKFPGLEVEVEGLPRALGVVRMAHRRCHQLRVGMVRVCVVGNRARIGLIDVGEMVDAREDLGVAHGGMAQVVEWAVEVGVTELFYIL